MSSFAMDTQVVELAFSHERAFERQRETLGFLARVFHSLEVIPLRVAKRVLLLLIERQSRAMRDNAVWFRGAAKEIDEHGRVEAIDPEFALVERLRVMEERLQELRSLAIANQSKDPKVRAAIHQLVSNSAGLFEAVRELRGAVQSYEADRCALEQAGRYPIENADELDQALASIHDQR